ncbi:hypothetical protein OC25_17670 [Pedobacter kyungheensis]|uniref:Uncharacterized protein n=1 Tax=Pedobacter kyungheensis TaxID=1069985 RepID=A0A0C1FH00_9SPHI|nr:hypothetical protein [Pedobacter kyungheensis]KIA92262.1 hypothetical protein OC25_17670 [Pedobacter kyungheensis]
MTDKKREELLELAWRTAFDSATYKVLGDGSHAEDLMSEATEYIRNIDRSEWFPVARQILRENNYIDDHNLAEEAATIFINKKMDTTGLRVSFGGDW